MAEDGAGMAGRKQEYTNVIARIQAGSVLASGSVGRDHCAEPVEEPSDRLEGSLRLRTAVEWKAKGLVGLTEMAFEAVY